MRVAIIGGGPGGLAAALALRALPFVRRVTVFERAPAFALDAGSGFGLAFNGRNVLRKLGLEEAVAPIAQPLTSFAICDGSGRVRRERRRAEALFMDDGAPAICGVLRPELMHVLSTALGDDIIMGVKAEVESLGGGAEEAIVRVTAADGGETRREAFDLVVASDGSRSQARDIVMGGASPPLVHSGTEIFYAVAPGEELAKQHEFAGTAEDGWITQAFGVNAYAITAGTKIVASTGAFPQAASTTASAGAASSTLSPQQGVYYGYVRRLDDHHHHQHHAAGSAGAVHGDGTNSGSGLTGERWGGSASESSHDILVRELGSGAWGPWFRDLVHATPPSRVLRIPLRSRDPFPRWWRGRVALVGDSAHTPLPSVGQGLNMALDDAWALATALADAAPQAKPAVAAASASQMAEWLPRALTAYQEKRHAKTGKMVGMSRQLLAMEAKVTNPLLAELRTTFVAAALPFILKGMKAEIAANAVC